jgi:sortase A
VKQKLTPATFLAIGAIAAGGAVVVTQLYSITFGESMISQQQLAAAEVEPLKISPDQFGANSAGQAFETGETIAKLYAPRFGDSYVRNIAEGTDLDLVLNRVGIGRYIGTQYPGEKGNFAIAGHRTGAGGPMREIDEFQAGDLVYVETAEAWHTYAYLETKIVDPNAIGTIAPDPEGLTNKVANQSYLTMTSCTPMYVNSQRIIAWFALVETQPASNGMPEALSKTFSK